jgi:hypothetical protein
MEKAVELAYSVLLAWQTSEVLQALRIPGEVVQLAAPVAYSV